MPGALIKNLLLHSFPASYDPAAVLIPSRDVVTRWYRVRFWVEGLCYNFASLNS
jgi:hypothetical protein